jgi:glycosyltransferase involved in cell wall biosynthesis
MLASVVICTYNAAPTLGKAIESALNQSLDSNEYEVLVIDDGSRDNTDIIVESYAKWHCNLRSIQFPLNRGLVPACNYGINASLGDHFIRLDADDEMHTDILSKSIEAMSKRDTDLVYTDRCEVDLDTGKSILCQIEPFNLFRMIAAGTLMRTDILRRIRGYRPFFWEEYDLYIRYLQTSGKPPVRLPAPMYTYNRHGRSMTADLRRVHEGWAQLRDEWGDDVLRQHGWSGPDSQEATE